jgi:hypothetical protein
LRALLLYLLILIPSLSGPATAFANDQLPVITSHSKLNFAVYRGDRIAFQVAAEGEDIAVKWIRSGETFCRELTCEVDTSSWGLGSHKIVVVVFNGKGSLFLRYKVRILTVPPGYKPGVVTPPVVDSSESIESLTADDFAVVTLQGRGFSSHNRKVQVVGPVARAIDWSEKLKTQPGSRLDFYARGREVHQLLSNSNVALVKAEDGRRAIALRKGTVRSRQLVAEDPQWSVISGNWLQVDGDSKADFFVRRLDGDKDEFLIGVFRGVVRVTGKKFSKQENGSVRYELLLQAGEAVTVAKKAKEAPQKGLGDPKTFAQVFRDSSEHYLSPGFNSDGFAERHIVLGEKLGDAQQDGLNVAQQALESLDFVVTLEALQKRLAKSDKDKDAALFAADAYIGLLQLADARTMISNAKRAAEDDPKAWFLEAVANMIERKWPECLKALDEAADRDFANEQLLDFYRGRCELGLDNVVAARNAFAYATWGDSDPAVLKAAREIGAALEDERWVLLTGVLGVGFDNNVFRLSEKSASIDDIGARESWFSNVYGKAEIWPFRVREGHAAFSVEGGRMTFTNKALKDFARVQQKVATEIQLNAGGETGRNFFFNAAAYIQTIGVGDKRNMDTLGNVLTLGAPVWWGLTLYNRNIVNSDPFPLWDDRIDAKRQEVVEAGDRSSKDKAVGLTLAPASAKDGGYGLGIVVEQLQCLYRDDVTTQENYTETNLALNNEYRPGPRNGLRLYLSNLTRGFTEAAEARKDSILRIDAGWEFLWSTSFRQDFSILYEAGSSTLDDYSFTRQVLRLDFTLAF